MVTSNTFDITPNSICSQIRSPHSRWRLQRAFIFPLYFQGLLSSFISTIRSCEFYLRKIFIVFFPFFFVSVERLCGFYLLKAYSFPICIETCVLYPLLFATFLIKDCAGLIRESLVKADVNSFEKLKNRVSLTRFIIKM